MSFSRQKLHPGKEFSASACCSPELDAKGAGGGVRGPPAESGPISLQSALALPPGMGVPWGAPANSDLLWLSRRGSYTNAEWPLQLPDPPTSAAPQHSSHTRGLARSRYRRRPTRARVPSPALAAERRRRLDRATTRRCPPRGSGTRLTGGGAAEKFPGAQAGQGGTARLALSGAVVLKSGGPERRRPPPPLPQAQAHRAGVPTMPRSQEEPVSREGAATRPSPLRLASPL